MLREVVWILYVDGISMCLCIDLEDMYASYVHPVLRVVAPNRLCLGLLISLWQISHIQTCVRVCFGPGFVSTSPAFNSSSAS